MTKIDAARSDLRDCEATLASITVSAAVMKAIETANAAVERASMQAELASARVEVTAAADVAVMIAGEPVELVAGATHSVVAGATTAVEVPDLLTVRVVPGEPAADSQALLDAARQHLASLLEGVGVPDVAAARAADERRRELASDRDRLRATCDGLLGDDDVEVLRTRLAELRATCPSTAWAMPPPRVPNSMRQLPRIARPSTTRMCFVRRPNWQRPRRPSRPPWRRC